MYRLSCGFSFTCKHRLWNSLRIIRRDHMGIARHCEIYFFFSSFSVGLFSKITRVWKQHQYSVLIDFMQKSSYFFSYLCYFSPFIVYKSVRLFISREPLFFFLCHVDFFFFVSLFNFRHVLRIMNGWDWKRGSRGRANRRRKKLCFFSV